MVVERGLLSSRGGGENVDSGGEERGTRCSGGMLTQNLSGRTEIVTCTDEVEGGWGFFSYRVCAEWL